MPNINKIIIGIVIAAFLGLLGYNQWQKRQLKIAQQEKIEAEIAQADELTPIIKDRKNELIITMDKIKSQEENIKIIRDSMDHLNIDTISLDEAINIIKGRASEYEDTENFDSIEHIFVRDE